MNRSIEKRFSTFRLFDFSTCVAVAALFAATSNAAVNFLVGTHIVKGTLKDWQNKVLTSTSEVTVQAVSTNGSVIASANVADPTADGYNFLLKIPLSSKATDYTAAFGDKLNCVLVQESGLSLALEPIKVGEADTVSTVCLALVETRSYPWTNADGTETTVNVASEYIDTIAVWMEALDVEGEYDPAKDYDGDGVKNYDEYRAGTNPFDATDKLAISAYAAPQNAPHAISFEYVGGHIYGVATTLSLTNPQWATQPVKKSETDVDHEQVMPSADEEDVGLATIYVVPAEGATSQFFKLEAK